MGQGTGHLRNYAGDTASYKPEQKEYFITKMFQKLQGRIAVTFEEIQVLLVLKEDKAALISYLTKAFHLNDGNDENPPSWPANFTFRPFKGGDTVKNRILPIFAYHLLTKFKQGFDLEPNGAEEPDDVNVADYGINTRVDVLIAMKQRVEQGNAPTWEQVVVLLDVDRSTLVKYLKDVYELAEDNHAKQPDWPEDFKFRPFRSSDTLCDHIRPIFAYHLAQVFQRGFQFEQENLEQGIQDLRLDEDDEGQARAPDNGGPVAEQVNEGQAQDPANALPN